MTEPRLVLDGLGKSFGGIVALRDVSLRVLPGEVHALLGENGAGKSTLVKIVTGVQQADRGEMRLDGVPVRFDSPMQARAAGVVAVYQDPKMFPHLSVAENIFMGLYPVGRLGLIDRRRMEAEARVLLRGIGSDLDPGARVAGLSVGEVQFVEFARARAGRADRLLILDEPTASLGPAETERLFAVVRRLRSAGTSVIVISHRLQELRGLVDTVTVLRDGARVATVPAENLPESEIVRMMVGRALADPVGRASASRGETRLRVHGLARAGAFADVSFEVAAGEIVGLFGLVGAGRTEIAQAIMGIAPADSGRITIGGRTIGRPTPRLMRGRGIGYVPEDRDRQGLVTAFSLRQNIASTVLRRLASFGVLRARRELALARRTIEQLSIRAEGPGAVVASLSGGNRQKVVLGKWLAIDPKVLLLDEPTHGIDVGAKAQVHRIISDLAARGVGVLLISSDLPEVLALSDRVLVVTAGRIVAQFAAPAANAEALMTVATRKIAA